MQILQDIVADPNTPGSPLAREMARLLGEGRELYGPKPPASEPERQRVEALERFDERARKERGKRRTSEDTQRAFLARLNGMGRR